MKKIFSLILACMLFALPALGEIAFTVPNAVPDDIKKVGILIVDEEADGIHVVFTRDVKNVVIYHECGASLSLNSAQAGDCVVVYSYIPDTIPNLSVSYSLPEDENEIVYTRMISQSGMDSSYIIMEDWYTTYAWFTAKRMLSLMNDEVYLSSMSLDEQILDYILNVCAALPDEMPENYYFLSTAFLEPIIEQLLKEEGIQMERDNFAYLMRQVPQTLKSMFKSREGVIAVASSSIMQADESLVIPDIPFEPGFVVFDDGGEYVIVVSVVLAGDGIARFQAGVVSRDALTSLIHLDSFLLGLVG